MCFTFRVLNIIANNFGTINNLWIIEILFTGTLKLGLTGATRTWTYRQGGLRPLDFSSPYQDSAGRRYKKSCKPSVSRSFSLVFCRPDQFSRRSYVDDNSCLFVSSLPFLFYTMSSHRDIYVYEILRNDYTVPTRCRNRGGMVVPLGCKACRAIR
jgi:hypothetical protein